MNSKLKRAIFVVAGITWCVVGAQVAMVGVSMALKSGKK